MAQRRTGGCARRRDHNGETAAAKVLIYAGGEEAAPLMSPESLNHYVFKGRMCFYDFLWANVFYGS